MLNFLIIHIYIYNVFLPGVIEIYVYIYICIWFLSRGNISKNKNVRGNVGGVCTSFSKKPSVDTTRYVVLDHSVGGFFFSKTFFFFY